LRLFAAVVCLVPLWLVVALAGAAAVFLFLSVLDAVLRAERFELLSLKASRRSRGGLTTGCWSSIGTSDAIPGVG